MSADNLPPGLPPAPRPAKASITQADLVAIDAETDAALERAAIAGEGAARTRETGNVPASVGGLPVIDVQSDWYNEAPPKRSWLLRCADRAARGVLPLGKVGELIAEGGAGKTMLLCQLAVAVATGGTWLGAYNVAPEGHGRVLLILGEEDAEEARRRLYRAARTAGGAAPAPGSIVALPLAGEVCTMLTTHEKTREPEESLFLAALRDYIEAGKFTLVIVDPLARFAGADAEKDNASATRFIQALESLAKLGPTVIVAHHTNKIARRKGGTLDASASRGSSAIVDGARWQCALAVEQFENLEAYLAEVVTFAVTKSNYAPKPPPILLRRDLENAGALVECDEDMVATIEAARKKDAGHSEKRAAQDQDQEKRRLDRKARDDSERAERLKLADEAKAAAVAKDADTGIAILMEIPDCSARAFRAEMKARIGAGSERADAALIRAKKALKPEEKKENGS